MTVNIYQINHERDTMGLIFRCWSEFEHQRHKRPPTQLYDRVYSYQAKSETPEGVYERFNLYHPADFTGHSLSVSDIVEILEDTGERKCFFCDSVGWKPVEFYSFLVGTENDFSRRLELLKEDRVARYTLMNVLIQRIEMNDNYPAREGRDLIQAYLDKNPEGILKCLSALGMESLVERAFWEEL
ncbi:MAG: YodL domain-containing protein [Firmicutes bacterium]|nr:YodL domain-containing protein [Bacillota bacterium]